LWIALAVVALGGIALIPLLKSRGAKARDGDRPVEPESVDELVTHAEQEAAAGNYNLARSALRRAIALSPENPGLRLNLLEVEYTQRDGASFSTDADELKNLLDGREGETWERVEAMGRSLCPHLPPFCPPEEATARREASVVLTPDYSVPGLVQRAEQESALGNYNLARSALRQASALSPEDPVLRLRLLRVEHEQDDRTSFAADAEDMLALPGGIEGEILEELIRMRATLGRDTVLPVK
jgi:Tfp pilus assembly protein FimV